MSRKKPKTVLSIGLNNSHTSSIWYRLSTQRGRKLPESSPEMSSNIYEHSRNVAVSVRGFFNGVYRTITAFSGAAKYLNTACT